MTDRVYNFSPGPAVLPVPVLEQAQRDLLSLPGIGISPLEISHRSKWFEGILAETKALLTELLGIPAGYSIVFLQGGSNLQFSMIPQNFLRGTGKTADYVVTGTWGQKAGQEAVKEGEVNIAWNGKSHNFSYLPAAGEVKSSPSGAYTHITSNETIQGVQFQEDPNFGDAPLITDVSSDFLSRPVDVSKYAMIYACAQKNAGISGVTVCILRDDMLERVPENLPTMLDFRQMVKNDSLYNTPPTFAIYIVNLICKWLKNDIGGLQKMADRNQSKASLLYDLLDGEFYQGHARPDCRSKMNVTFRLQDEALEKTFVQQAAALQLFELKGHRSVGGIRASIYNAMPVEGVQLLATFMKKFRQDNG
ncbi:MAG: 3-phosphoserine/phosphohydroxythreonine transaminase [Planctomycetota bacterium]|nr:3-phosphoserine/phosphohydroxythreonine transaminase [Planctomycetota bacterium]